MYSNSERLLVEDMKEDVLSQREQKLLVYY